MKPMTVEIAVKLKLLLLETDPLIEEFTAAICPACSDVCCRHKHAALRDRDREYLNALGEPVPPYDPRQDPDGPCQFMGDRGCTLSRWYRAFKCTWFFCEPLLDAMDKAPQRKARRLSAALQEMVDLYNGMYDEAEGIGNGSGAGARRIK